MRLDPDRQCLACDYCHNAYFPEEDRDGVRVLGEPSASMCPLCAMPLEHAAVAGIAVLHCPKCRGLLVDMERFVAIFESLRADREETAVLPHPDPEALNRRIVCPGCGNPMDTHYYGGGGNVVIDNCANCCLNWLDHSELDRIVKARDYGYAGEITSLDLPREEERSY